jgi:DNA-binding GntR family transcriptional regulator
MEYDINRDSPIPYYYQIQLRLKDAIEKGEWNSNEFIPSERELSSKFNVSRITTKKAIINLRAEGYLKIIKGKGAIVAKSKIEEHFFYNVITSYQELKDKGYKVENKIFKFEIIKPEQTIIENLNLSSEDKVYYIERLRFINDEPYHYTKSYLPLYLYKNLNVKDLIENSIYDLLTNKYKQIISKIEKVFEASKTSFEDSKLFNTSVNFPLLFFINKTFNTDNKPIEFSYNKIRGDLSKFKVVVDVNKTN